MFTLIVIPFYSITDSIAYKNYNYLFIIYHKTCLINSKHTLEPMDLTLELAEDAKTPML